MRRADRLFQIIQILSRKRVATGEELAAELEVSRRTVYRDLADLSASGVPILGEAGVGYTLAREFRLPPLMFTEDEVESLVLGARMVRAWSDRALAEAASSVQDKLRLVLPARLAVLADRTPLHAAALVGAVPARAGMAQIRSAIKARRKVHIHYADANGTKTERVIHPVALVFWGTVWTVTAWCETRKGMRNFRLDRLLKTVVLPKEFAVTAAMELAAEQPD